MRLGTPGGGLGQGEEGVERGAVAGRGPRGFLEFVSSGGSFSDEAPSHNTGICWSAGVTRVREEEDRRKCGKWI